MRIILISLLLTGCGSTDATYHAEKTLKHLERERMIEVLPPAERNAVLQVLESEFSEALHSRSTSVEEQ